MLTMQRPTIVEFLELTRSLKKTVPEIEGVTDKGSTLELRRSFGEFSALEANLLEAIVVAHDGASIIAENNLKLTNQQVELKKDPISLTLEQRVKRLEIILGVEVA